MIARGGPSTSIIRRSFINQSGGYFDLSTQTSKKTKNKSSQGSQTFQLEFSPTDFRPGWNPDFNKFQEAAWPVREDSNKGSNLGGPAPSLLDIEPHLTG